MARGKTLGDLLNSLRAEMNLSLNPAHNNQTRDKHIIALQRVQESLWEDYSWPFLRADRFIQPQAGQRYYDPAGCKKLNNVNALVDAGDLRADHIDAIWVRDGDIWRELVRGIPQEVMNAWDSETGERSWPPERWAISDEGQIEIWPIPGQTGDETTLIDMLKVTGTRNLAPLVADSDRADLDDRLLTLMVAAEQMDGEAAQKKQAAATRLLYKLRGNQNTIRRFRMFGEQEPTKKLRGPPTVYYRKDT